MNVAKEYWESSAEYCMNKIGGVGEEVDGEEWRDENMDEMEKVVLMFSSLKGGDIFVVMIRGAETRWWTLGEAADVLFKTLPMRRFMAKNYDD